MTKEIRLTTIEYTTKDGTLWKANVLSEGIQESINFIRKLVPEFDRMHSTDMGDRVDQMTPYVKDMMTVEVIKEVEKTTDINVPNSFTCCWCDKEFKTLNNLKNHIIKFHIED